MKTVHTYPNRKVIPYRSHSYRRFPNAADGQYYKDRLLDWILAAATCLGAVSILLFLITMM